MRLLKLNCDKKAFTLIELTLVIVILGIVGAFGAAFFAPILNLYFFTPTQLRTEYTANRIMDAVIEGDTIAKGLRMTSIEASGSITAASDSSITYKDVDGKTITISWSNVTYKVSRSVNAGPAGVLPPEAPNNDINIDGTTSGIIFKYYDSSDALISTPVSVPNLLLIGRIQMDWQAYTGSGNVKAAQGKYLIHSGVQIKQF